MGDTGFFASTSVLALDLWGGQFEYRIPVLISETEIALRAEGFNFRLTFQIEPLAGGSVVFAPARAGGKNHFLAPSTRLGAVGWSGDTEEPMTGEEFRAVRYQLGLSAQEWGRALGYGGKPNSIRSAISQQERGVRPVPRVIALLAKMYARHGVPTDDQGEGGRAARLEGWFHSITRSARTSTETGIVIPNSFATFWFTVSSKRVGCMIGSSPGFAPRAILSRYKTTPWAASSKLSP